MTHDLTRRRWLATASALGTATLTASTAAASAAAKEPFRYCFNTSTISGSKLPIVEVVQIAARAGYQAVELWIRELDAHVQAGRSLKDLGKLIRDCGLVVPSAIGFAEWLVDDEPRRKKGFEEAKRSMELVRQIGGLRLAAPPAGATNQSDLNLARAAERYRALLELGAQMGVVPELEFWGPSKSLSRLSEAVFVAMESGHPAACVLPDVYHLYKGGSDFNGIKLLGGNAFHVIHFNDYPAQPSRETINDSHRIYPGDGVALLGSLLRDLQAIGFHGFLSLELFNREYWMQDALAVAKTGLDKTKAAVAKALME